MSAESIEPFPTSPHDAAEFLIAPETAGRPSPEAWTDPLEAYSEEEQQVMAFGYEYYILVTQKRALPLRPSPERDSINDRFAELHRAINDLPGPSRLSDVHTVARLCGYGEQAMARIKAGDGSERHYDAPLVQELALYKRAYLAN
jgi:hypothetical protein